MSADSFFKISFSLKYFRNMIRMSNSLDPDHVRPDLGPNCLQRLSADDTVFTKYLNEPADESSSALFL